MSDMFKYVVWPQSAPDALCTVDALIDGDFYTRNSELIGVGRGGARPPPQ